MHADEEDHAQPGWKHQDVDRTSRGRVRMAEYKDKWTKYVHGVANPRIEGGFEGG